MRDATGPARHRVLLVEDEMLVAMSIEVALLDGGYCVVGPAGALEKALELVRAAEFDVAVLDMNLDGRSGLPVADALAASDVPFVVLSGYGAGALGGAHPHAPVMSKPFDSDQLLRVLDRLLQERAPSSAVT